MSLWRRLRKPPWRTIVPAVLLVGVAALWWLLWSPGADITDGRHDLGRNGLWMQHGWLGDDKWFERNRKTDRMAEFRDPVRMAELADRLRRRHISDLFPHLCPTHTGGQIADCDGAQVERFCDAFAGFRVMPWVGGAEGVQVDLARPKWRQNFADSVAKLLTNHPRLAGVHVNVEPCPSGNGDFLLLLEQTRAAMPADKLLSVAAYPPPTRWHPHPDVHWEESYFREVAARCDQMVVMMYDTALTRPKIYRWLMSAWTREALAWAGDTPVLLGLPCYEDAGVEYHHPEVENLPNALRGIHGGLEDFDELPANYQGVALYSEWTLDDAEWDYFRKHFLKAE